MMNDYWRMVYYKTNGYRDDVKDLIKVKFEILELLQEGLLIKEINEKLGYPLSIMRKAKKMMTDSERVLYKKLIERNTNNYKKKMSQKNAKSLSKEEFIAIMMERKKSV